MLKRKNKLGFTTFILAGMLSLPVFAQDTLPPVVKMDAMAEASVLPDVQHHMHTHPEKIVFSHLKLAKAQPDFDAFAQASPLVEKAQEIDKSAMTLAEYNRIANSFNLHDETATVVVKTSVRLDEYSSLQDLLVLDEFDAKTFFRFAMYGYNVGIVPEDIQKFSHLSLSKPSAERLFSLASDKVTAEFLLKPVYADAKEPLVMDNAQYWLMFARVVEFRLWSNKDTPELLWYYRAPWYAPEDNTGIGDLYTKG